jgi:TonB-dependent starch-binding outer membrane protein SusC
MKIICLTGFPDRETTKKWGRIMRITLFLMVGFLLTASANSYSQSTRLNIKLKDGTVTELMKFVEDNSEFVFLYKNEDLDLKKKVDVELENATIQQVLDAGFKGQNVGWDVYDRQIILHRALAKRMPAENILQQRTVTGVVTDQSGQPLPGVTVVVAGTTTGTVTNSDGNFSLAIPDGAETLQFSFVGMRTQEIPIDGRTTFTVVMEEETIGLKKVVAIGYGTMKKSDLTEEELAVHVRNNITNWLMIGVNTFGSFTDFSGIGPGSFLATSPFITPYEENGELSIYPKGESTTHLNPFLNIQADHKQIGNQISGIFYGELKIPKIDGLRYRINYNKSLSWSENFTGNQYGAGLSGSVSKMHASRSEETFDNIITYEKQLNKHRINATLVYGSRKANYNSTNSSGTNVPNISLSYNSLQQAIIQEISSGAWNEAALYQMARINYNYNDRYLVTGTFRRDGFSGFARNNKFALFPSAGIGWVLTNEPFFNITKIDYLKIRASYGQNGNQTSRYSSLARVAAIDDYKYVFGDGGSSSMGQAMSSLANDDLSWEKTTGMNYGIDFGIFDNRITGNAEYYRTTTTDLLWDMIIPEVTGFSSIKTNIGEVANAGFELYIQATPVKTGNFSWDFGVNFSANKNKIISLLGYDFDGDGIEDDLLASGLFIGKSIGTIYHYEIDGIWQVNDDIPVGYNPGNYKIVDQNDDGKITADDDRVFLGRSEPAYMAGIQNSLNYNNFTLRFFINTIQGGKNSYLGGQFGGSALNSTGNFANTTHFTFFDHWSVTNPDGKYSVWYQAPQINPTQYLSRSFVRLQDISLAYRMNQSFIQNIGVQGVKLYVSGKNLLTNTTWDGWDPETNQGIGSGYYPVMKSLTLGVDIEF